MERVIRSSQYFSTLPVSVLRMKSQTDDSGHSHEFCELVVIKGGNGVHAAGGVKWPVAAGDVFLIRQAVKHAYEDTRNLKLINILFDPGRVKLPEKELRRLPGYNALFSIEPALRERRRPGGRLRIGARDLAMAERLIEDMEREIKSGEPGNNVVVAALFIQLITHFARCYRKADDRSSGDLLRVGEAISYIENHYEQEVTLGQLAGMARMARRSFQRAFHEAIGVSPIEHVIRVRVANAAELLRSGRFNVTSAAYETGFGDSNYFCRQFRRIMGVSPGIYRRAASAVKM
jgi:AraC-like DNA-binding protein